MDENRSPLLANLPHRIRTQRDELKANFHQWWADVREDPSLLWRTTAVRVAFWVVVGVGALLAARAVSKSMLAGGGAADSDEAAPLAIIRVACTNPACYTSYTTSVPMDFDAWPLICEKCGQPTVYRAKLCPRCRKWYATAPGASKKCPFCAAAEPEQPAKPPETTPLNPDDAEDPW